jgi:hypothetical protein
MFFAAWLAVIYGVRTDLSSLLNLTFDSPHLSHFIMTFCKNFIKKRIFFKSTLCRDVGYCLLY